ncbi:hypothetical protein ES332_D02G154100v1 [Gossypium tomentosum]|uniref:Uncharacterized protein n=1 Tax=Gossypium tomentosum TaxID=34277 RepID=A0A5D2LXJ5_GOSTO|nr:hypothetical protein ES332_D02G154100v1 [Gossypium tomentosum]
MRLPIYYARPTHSFVWLGVMLLHPDFVPHLLRMLAVIAILIFKHGLGIPPNSLPSFSFSALILSDVSQDDNIESQREGEGSGNRKEK